HRAAEPETAAFARPREPAIAREVDEPRLPRVEFALPERRLEANLAAQPPDRVGVDVERVALGRRRRGEIAELVKPRDQPLDLTRAVERRPMPWIREVAPL